MLHQQPVSNVQHRQAGALRHRVKHGTRPHLVEMVPLAMVGRAFCLQLGQIGLNIPLLYQPTGSAYLIQKSQKIIRLCAAQAHSVLPL